MLKLLINSLPAVVKAGTTFKLVRENPVFSDGGDYTLDVQLPLAGCPANQRILGPLHRPEAPLVPAMAALPFELRADGLELSGTCRVVQADQAEAKVQLLAGAGALRLAATDGQGKELCIDELPLGRAYDTAWKAYYPFTGTRPEQTMEGTIDMLLNAPPDWAAQLMYGGPGVTECVSFPVHSETDSPSECANQRSLHRFYTGDRLDGQCWHFMLATDKPNAMPGAGTGERLAVRTENVLAPQPYLSTLLSRVLACCGYTLSSADNCLLADWRGRIFMANARAVLDYAAVLPHWTVGEFLLQLQRLLGVALLVEGRRVRVVDLAGYAYGSPGDGTPRVELRHVADQRQAELDEEAATDHAGAGNVGYDLPDEDPLLRVPDDVWQKAERRDYETLDDLRADLGTDTELSYANDESAARRKAARRCLCTAGHPRRTYAALRREPRLDNERSTIWAEVDMYGPLLRREGTRDLDITLKMTPCRHHVEKVNINVFRRSAAGNPYALDKDPGTVSIALLVTSDTRVARTCAPPDIPALLQGTDDEQDTGKEVRDVIELALNGGHTHDLGDGITVPAAVGTAVITDTGVPYFPFGADTRPFALKGAGEGTLAACIAGAGIDTRVQHVVTFTDRGSLNPAALFLIRGRRYACLKIEYTVGPDGVQPLKTGYFYEISEQ